MPSGLVVLVCGELYCFTDDQIVQDDEKNLTPASRFDCAGSAHKWHKLPEQFFECR